jgi:hypothetical protein
MASNINTLVILTFAFIPMLLIFQIYLAGRTPFDFGCLCVLVSRQLWVNKQSKDLHILCKRNWLNYRMGVLENGEKQKTGKGRERREEHNVSKRTTSLLITLHYFDYKVGKYIDLRKGKDQSTKRETKG